MAENEVVDDRSVEAVEGFEPALLETVLASVREGNAQALAEALAPVHSADLADLLQQLDADTRQALLALYAPQIDGELISEADESVREDIIEALPLEQLAEVVRELESDELVDIIEDMDEGEQNFILESLDAEDREAVTSALLWPEGSAGRLMQSELVSVPEAWNVGQAIDFLRATECLPDQFYHLILTDEGAHPTGYVTLGRALSAKRNTHLLDIVEDSFRVVQAQEDEGEVARLFNKYHLISMAVVDQSGKLVGVITIDDAMEVLDEEAEEDILRLAGVSEESSLSDRIWVTTKGRFVWLLVNLFTAIMASFVISMFSDEIDAMVALAVLMPIVASMGGNAGTQSMTVAVRALATRELTSQNATRVLWREVTVGVINGAAFGVIMSAVAAFWFGVPLLALVIAVAMVVTLASAAFAGILLPIALERLGIDPALASGPFVTTVTDVVGFFAFLGLASVVLL